MLPDFQNNSAHKGLMQQRGSDKTMDYFTKGVNPRLAEPPLKFSGGLGKLRLTPLVNYAVAYLNRILWSTIC